VAEVAEGYNNVPEEDRKKAQVFFHHGRTKGSVAQYDYAIEMFVQGLEKDPDDIKAHQELRDFSLKRKASGGKGIGFMEGMKLKRPQKEDKQNMLNAEKLLAYEPGETSVMLTILQSALRAGYFDTVLWMGPILQKANADDKKPDFNKFMILKDAYKQLARQFKRADLWKLATDACHYALRMRPDDMDLQTEVKNLGAFHTMAEGQYEKGGSFRDSVRDAKGQKRLLDDDKGVRSSDALLTAINEAEKEYAADPNEPGKLMRLVDTLLKTDDTEHEERAVNLLQAEYDKGGQFRFRRNVGQIRIKQMERIDRQNVVKLKADPANEEVKQSVLDFRKEKAEYELVEYEEWSHAYPTDMTIKFMIGERMFQLRRFDDAIPVLQQARADPKVKVNASIYLGQSFLESGFLDEAVETLKVALDEYNVKGDARSKDLHYWSGRATEFRGDDLAKNNPQAGKTDWQAAMKLYSQVFQWDSQFRDVALRIKNLRAKIQSAGG